MIPTEAITSWISSQSADTVGGEVYEWLELIYNAAVQKLLTVGGTVKVTIITSEFKAPSKTLVDAVQQILDPSTSAGEGDGVVPIGHVVNVCGVGEEVINISSNITYDTGYNFETLKENIEETIDRYLLELRQTWASNNNLIIRISKMESLLLDLEGIVDIADTKINGIAENRILDADYIPVRGEIDG